MDFLNYLTEWLNRMFCILKQYFETAKYVAKFGCLHLKFQCFVQFQHEKDPLCMFIIITSIKIIITSIFLHQLKENVISSHMVSIFLLLLRHFHHWIIRNGGRFLLIVGILPMFILAIYNNFISCLRDCNQRITYVT